MIKLSAFADEYSNNFDKQIEALVKNNIPYIELRSLDGMNVKDMTLDQAYEYKRKLDNYGIEVWSIGSPLGKVDVGVDIDEYMQVVRHVLDLCEIFGAKRVRMFSFFTSEYDKYADKVVSMLSIMVKEATTRGILLCHENEKHIYGDSPERILHLLDNVDGLCYVYDPANYLQCGEDIDKCLSMTADRAEYYHIKDVDTSTDLLVPAGYGDGKIDKMIKLIDRDTVLTLEPHLKVFDGYAEIDGEEMKNKFKFDTNEEAFDFAVKSLKELLIKCGYIEVGDAWTKE
ncbi:MAG: sugar phosphate isomerase/epimerase [Clostridia bacterium]|nr:sugar phosphate isomerase/epimerase [Clostridia bacterium]